MTRTFRQFFALPLLLAAAALPGRQAKASDIEGLPAASLQDLNAAQDAYNSLDFARAESLAAGVIARFPSHPLPKIFMQGSLLAQIQAGMDARSYDPALLKRYEEASQAAISASAQMEALSPSAVSSFYLGASLGARGLVLLYQGHYIDAFRDGKKGNQALLLAVKRDPKLYNAYLGIGQYLYYCGRLSGLLRLVLNLHGDIPGGIADLQLCGLQGSYAAIPARICLARIFCNEEVDYLRALPYVLEIYQRYGRNYEYVQYALRESLGLGLETPAAQSLLESVCAQWDQGWRPPAYAKLSLEPARLKLAKAYLLQGKQAQARAHLALLAQSADKSVAKAAQKLLEAPP